MQIIPEPRARVAFIRSKPIRARKGPVILVILNNFLQIAGPCAGDVSFQGVPYQLSTVA